MGRWDESTPTPDGLADEYRQAHLCHLLRRRLAVPTTDDEATISRFHRVLAEVDRMPATSLTEHIDALSAAIADLVGPEAVESIRRQAETAPLPTAERQADAVRRAWP